MIFRPPLSAATPVDSGSEETVGGGLVSALLSNVTSGSIPTWCAVIGALIILFDMALWLPFVHADMFPGEIDALTKDSLWLLACIAAIAFRKNAKQKGWNQTIAEAAKIFYNTSIDTEKFAQAAPPAIQRALADMKAKAAAGEIPKPPRPTVEIPVHS